MAHKGVCHMKHIYILSCERNGGISHYLFDKGQFKFVEKTSLDRPMYAIIRENKMHVVLREIDSVTHFGGMLSFEFDETGNLVNPTDIESTGGIVPCHLEVVGNDKFVVNYLSGNVVKMGHKVVTHSGAGVHPIRQDAPHTHFVCESADKKYILCTDLGIDRIFVYDEKLQEEYAVQLPNGSGPRHLCFSGDGQYLYCVNELSNCVSVLKWNEGKPILRGTYATIPDFKGESTAAAIRINGEYLYISNRGANTISRFRIKEEALELLDNTDCGGKGPRDFNIFEDYIICANENSHDVTVLKLENGKPFFTDVKVELGSPLCVVL